MENNIHNIGSTETYKKRHELNSKTKILHIISATEQQMKIISIDYIKMVIKKLDHETSNIFKDAIHDKDAEKIGNIILMTLYTDVQSTITKTLYP